MKGKKMKAKGTVATLRQAVSLLTILLLVSRPMLGFKVPTHLAITQEVLKSISKTVGSNTYQFTDKAIDEVMKANKDTDECLTCQTNSSFHFDDENFSGGSQRLVDLKNKILQDLSGSSPDGKKAREHLGQALHTLQDFYAHSNRVEANLSNFDNLLGVSAFSGFTRTTQTCPSAPSVLGGAGLTGPTSGWFPLPSPCNSSIPTGKCRHGNDETLGGLFDTCDGINKDSPTSSTHGALYFDTARSLAKTATDRYVEQLILNDPSITNNAKAVKALMGVSTTLGFTIDTTGSMFDIIDAVKANVSSIVSSVVGTPDEPDQYLLEPFNDPFWGPVTTTSDSNVFLSQVSFLSASGGGDCPELAMHGLLEAVNAADPQSTIYLFTDASAKDSALFPNVSAIAEQKKIKIKYGLFGSCSPIDPGFQATAAATGGQVFFLNRFFESNSLFGLVASEIGPPQVTIVHTAGTLPSGTQTVTFPVDSAVTQLTVAVSVDSLTSVTLTRPDSSVVSPGDPGVTLTPLSTGSIFLLRPPVPGSWTLQIQGFGSYSVDVQGKTTRDQLAQLPNLHDFNFVTVTGRVGHQGYFAIQGQPVVGDPQTVDAALSGSVTNVSFNFISEAGDILNSLTLVQNDPNANPTDFAGPASLPAQPFRVMATGLDGTGSPFQRTYSVLFRPQTVRVSRVSFLDGLPEGQTTSLTFTVQNLGPPGTFNLVASDGANFVTGVNPASVTLDTGATATVTVTLNVPLSAPLGEEDATTLVATSVADPNVRNSAVQTLDVIGAFTFDGGGQRPRDVNKFLTYSNPTDSPVTLPPDISVFPLSLAYGPTTIPATFSATLNGTDISGLFHPQAGTFETVMVPLASGKNLLVLQIDGTVSSGRVATDTDRLVFNAQ